jgi:hypothetical protein
MLNNTAWSGNYYAVPDRDKLCLILQPGVVGIIMLLLNTVTSGCFWTHRLINFQKYWGKNFPVSNVTVFRNDTCGSLAH